MTSHRLLLTAILGLAATTATASDATLQFETKDLVGGETQRGRMFIQGDNLRIETQGGEANAGPSTIIFRGDRDTLYVLDDREKSYMELNQETIAAMTGAMSAMMKEMQERVQAMPPEQRQMMEQMMKGKMPEAAAKAEVDRHELKRNGEDKDIGGYPCTRWDATRNDERVAELWLTPFAKAGVDPKTFAVLGDMADFFQGVMGKLRENPMMKAQSSDGAELLSAMKGLEGVPVLVRRIENGVVSEETRLTSISGDDLRPELFDFASYTKKDIMGGVESGGRPRP